MVTREVQTRRQYILFFALVAAVVAAALILGRPRKAALLDAVPRDSWLVVTVDVAALRQSPLAKPLLGGGDKAAAVPGLGTLVSQCGFDPMVKLREVAATSPENGERGDFGVAFTGDFTKDELVACASNTIKARGGSPTTATRGGFTVVEDSGDPKHARVAYRDGGPFLVGRGAWLDAMIDAVEGKGERMRPEHVALRDGFAPKAGTPASAILATALLPSAMRERLKSEVSSELGLGEEGKGSAGNATYLAVLGVSAAGLSVSTGGEGSTTEIAARLECESASQCDEVKTFIERKRLALSREMGVRLIGLGPLLDSLALDARGKVLAVTARASSDELARGVQRALDFSSRGRDATVRPAQAQQPPAPGTSAPSASASAPAPSAAASN
jgi:hypothetical protein